MRILCIVLSAILLLGGCAVSQLPDNEKPSASGAESEISVSTPEGSAQSIESSPAQGPVAEDPAQSVIPNDNNKPVSVDEGSNQSVPGNTQQEDHREPPKQLFFDNYDSIFELKSLLDKSDKEVEAYLVSHNFDMNGLASRSDVEKLLATLKEVHLPVINGLDCRDIVIYPDDNIMSIWYDFDDVVKYNFRVTTLPDYAKTKIASLQSSGQLTKGISQVMRDESITMSSENSSKMSGLSIYGVITERTTDDLQSYAMDVDGTYILVRVFNADGLKVAMDGLMAFTYEDGASLS